ncbi:hypothetical protein HKX48_007878 [Thoreauomyces humboldtii]|nr:hypothetical protein HKX48_007878 [Thoreauomyces humboldtii]
MRSPPSETESEVSLKLVKMTVAAANSTGVLPTVAGEVMVPGTWNLTLQLDTSPFFLGLVNDRVALLWTATDSDNATVPASVQALFVTVETGAQEVTPTTALQYPTAAGVVFRPVIDTANGLIYALGNDIGATTPCILRFDLRPSSPTRLCKSVGTTPVNDFVLTPSTASSDPDTQNFTMIGNDIAFNRRWDTLPSTDITPTSNYASKTLSLLSVPGWGSSFTISAHSVAGFDTTNLTATGWPVLWKNRMDDVTAVEPVGMAFVGVNVQRGWIYVCTNMTVQPGSTAPRMFSGSLVAMTNRTGSAPWDLASGGIPCSNQTVLTSADGDAMMVSTTSGVGLYKIATVPTVGNVTAVVSSAYTFSFKTASEVTARDSRLQLTTTSPTSAALLAPVLVNLPDSSVVALIGDTVLSLPFASRGVITPVTPSAGPGATVGGSSNSSRRQLIVPLTIVGSIALIFIVFVVAWIVLRRRRNSQNKSFVFRQETGTIRDEIISVRPRSSDRTTRPAEISPVMATIAARTSSDASVTTKTRQLSKASIVEGLATPELYARGSNGRRLSLLEEIDQRIPDAKIMPFPRISECASISSLHTSSSSSSVKEAAAKLAPSNSSAHSTLTHDEAPDGTFASTPLTSIPFFRSTVPEYAFIEEQICRTISDNPEVTWHPEDAASSFSTYYTATSRRMTMPRKVVAATTPPAATGSVEDGGSLRTAGSQDTFYTGRETLSSSEGEGENLADDEADNDERADQDGVHQDDDERWSLQDEVFPIGQMGSTDGMVPIPTLHHTMHLDSSPSSPIKIPSLERKRNFPSHSLARAVGRGSTASLDHVPSSSLSSTTDSEAYVSARSHASSADGK